MIGQLQEGDLATVFHKQPLFFILLYPAKLNITFTGN